jgi:hypothetical protein
LTQRCPRSCSKRPQIVLDEVNAPPGLKTRLGLPGKLARATYPCPTASATRKFTGSLKGQKSHAPRSDRHRCVNAARMCCQSILK